MAYSIAYYIECVLRLAFSTYGNLTKNRQRSSGRREEMGFAGFLLSSLLFSCGNIVKIV